MKKLERKQASLCGLRDQRRCRDVFPEGPGKGLQSWEEGRGGTEQEMVIECKKKRLY